MEKQKLSEKELKKVQENYSAIAKIKNSLGDLEMQYSFQKSALLSEYSVIQNKMNEIVKEIEEEHGKSTLDINTGELTPVEEEQAEPELLVAE